MSKEDLPVTASTNDQDNEFSESGKLSADGGVVKEIIQHGVNGWQKPENGDDVQMHYRGTLLDGTEFDSSYSRNTPFVFKLGEGKVIKGWDIVGKTMAKGEKAKVTLRPEYAYGDSGSPPKIPQNATLVFEMELLSWTSKRDVFGDGLVIKSEINAGEGWERPGKLAEVTLAIDAVAVDDATPNESKPLYSGETTFSLGSSKAPEAWEKVVPDMKKGTILQLVCKHPRTIGPGVDYVPEGTPCVRYQITLKSWRKIEDILSDGTLVKKVLSEGEGWERPSDGANAIVAIKYFLPSKDSTLLVPPPAGDALHVVEAQEFQVGAGIVIDGIDRCVQSMKLKESAMVSIDPQHAFSSAPTLLMSELSVKNVTLESTILVEITLSKFDKARDVWTMSFEDKIEEMKIRKQRGNELFKDGRYVTAKKSYERAISFFDSPTTELSVELKTQVNALLVQCHLNLAMCLDRVNDTPNVLVHCKKALEFEPSNVKALYRQGCAFLAMDDYYNALSSLKYARELNPGNLDVVKKMKELKAKRLRQDAEDKKLFSNLFGRMSKMEAKEETKKSTDVDEDAMDAEDANGDILKGATDGLLDAGKPDVNMAGGKDKNSKDN